LQKEVLIARDQLCQEVYLLMRGAIQVASGETPSADPVSAPHLEGARAKATAVSFRMIERPGSIIGHIDPFQREVPRYPFLVTAVRQAHLVCLSRVDVLDVLSNFEGEDCDNVLKVLRDEHERTVESLTDKRGDKGAAAKVSSEQQQAQATTKDGTKQPSEHTLQTLRTRVTAMEQKLAQCVDDMQAARECTEVLPHLVYLVNSAASEALNS